MTIIFPTFHSEEHLLFDIKGPLFAMRLFRDDRELSSSIQNFGVLNPPRLLREDGVLKTIDGWARVEAAKKRGLTKLSCLVFDAVKSDDGSIFLLAMELNCWDREFNLAERALCLQQATNLFEGTKIPKPFWEMVGIKENIRAIYQHREFLKLPQSIQKYAITNDIPLQTILGFLRFPPAQVESIASLLFLLPLNRNKLAEILTLLFEITKREGLMPLDILTVYLRELDGEQNLFQKEQKLRERLLQRRNPELSRHLQKFQKAVDELSLPEEIKIEPAPFFEDEYVTLNAKIRSLKDRVQLVEMLKAEGFEKVLACVTSRTI